MKVSEESQVALRAMERAALSARRLAAEKKILLPIWRDGGIVYIDPREESQPGTGANGEGGSAGAPPPSP